MDIYRYYAENERIRYIFFYTYKASARELLSKLEALQKQPIHIFDVFPEPNTEEKVLKEPLSVITESGQEMFLPVGIKINIFDMGRVLFGKSEE